MAARFAHVVHTIDSEALVRELGKRAARERASPLAVLIEVNVGGEPQKAGASPSEIDEVMAAVRAQPSLALRGLMTVPPAAIPTQRGARSRRSPSCGVSTEAWPRCPSCRWA